MRKIHARLRVALTIIVAIACDARQTKACGVSASGAPAGICDASDVLDEKSSAARDRIGASYGYTSSVLFFTNNLRTPTERNAVMLSFEHPLKNHFTLEFGAGSLVSGFLDTPLGRATFSPGVLGDVSLSHLLIQSHGYAQPFLLLSFTLAGVWSQTSYGASSAQTPYVAFDFSASVATGVALRVGPHTLTPFIAGRLFGGPVFWSYGTPSQNVLGTDAYKYSLGPGFAVAIAHARISLSLGASLFGERSLRSGLSVSF